jgi:Cupin-like domain
MSRAPSEIAGRDLSRERFVGEVVAGCQPVVLRGLVNDWPAVRAARDSPRALMSYLAAFDAGVRIEVFFGDPAIAGKYYYGAGLKGFNFERRMMAFREALQAIIDAVDAPGVKSVYAGSAPCRECLPGFAPDNLMPLLAPETTPRIWLGTASNVSSHYDTFDNLACVIAGHRRFTLYAPELIGRLYVGPIDRTMAGPPVSLAASSPQDDQRFPLFSEVRDQAWVCELQAGDALYLPKLWWHQVESLAAFNGLVNYWWDAQAVGPDSPYTSLLLAMITIAERPPAERQAWKAFFDHYVFRTHGHPLAHLPAEERGVLGPLKPDNYANIRARVMQLLRGR